MGYTHYWTQLASFTKMEWLQICADVRAICDASSVAHHVAVYDDNGGEIVINGVSPDDYESFHVTRKRDPARLEMSAPQGWNFCKTESRPYDVIVTAILCYLESYHPTKYVVTSDGDASEWQDGITLAKVALPRLHNVLRIPADVMFRDPIAQHIAAGVKCEAASLKNGDVIVFVGHTILAQFSTPAARADAIKAIEAHAVKIRRIMNYQAMRLEWDRALRRVVAAAPQIGGERLENAA